MPHAAVLAICLGLLAVATGSGPGRSEPGPGAPPLLSHTGLYQADGQTLAAGNRSYSPQYPLWSDGADKARWVYLPPGTAIDTRNPDSWEFPAGTKFWKQFSFKGRKVETRLLWKTAQGWIAATYAWNPEQTEASLAPVEGLPGHLEIAPGRRHSLPSLADCKACHDNGRFEVLGFGALQLSADRDPLAPHAEPLVPGMLSLAELVQGGQLPGREAWLREPPRIRAASPRERAVLGYLSANCGSCHQADGPLAGSSLRLRQTLAGPGAPALITSLGRPGHYDIPKLKPGTTMRLQPGSLANSSIHYRMNLRGGRAQMPPLATVLVDAEAAALLAAWIKDELPGRKGAILEPTEALP